MNTPHLTIDWGGMTVNSLGNEFFPTSITDVALAHFPNLTRRQIQDDFINLETLATRSWSGEIPMGVSVDLATLLDVNGSPFPGIDSPEGVWLIALRCTSNRCNNPAPWSFVFLQACP